MDGGMLSHCASSRRRLPSPLRSSIAPLVLPCGSGGGSLNDRPALTASGTWAVAPALLPLCWPASAGAGAGTASSAAPGVVCSRTVSGPVRA
eukprot:362611-Chlamydomonas_euryale.AAC.3